MLKKLGYKWHLLVKNPKLWIYKCKINFYKCKLTWVKKLCHVICSRGEIWLKQPKFTKKWIFGAPPTSDTSCVRVKLKKCLFSLGSIVPKIIDCYQTNQNDVRNEKIHSELMSNFFKVKVSFLTGVTDTNWAEFEQFPFKWSKNVLRIF